MTTTVWEQHPRSHHNGATRAKANVRGPPDPGAVTSDGMPVQLETHPAVRVGFEPATNGIQFYVFANKDKTSLLSVGSSQLWLVDGARPDFQVSLKLQPPMNLKYKWRIIGLHETDLSPSSHPAVRVRPGTSSSWKDSDFQTFSFLPQPERPELHSERGKRPESSPGPCKFESTITFKSERSNDDFKFWFIDLCDSAVTVTVTISGSAAPRCAARPWSVMGLPARAGLDLGLSGAARTNRCG